VSRIGNLGGNDRKNSSMRRGGGSASSFEHWVRGASIKQKGCSRQRKDTTRGSASRCGVTKSSWLGGRVVEKERSQTLENYPKDKGKKRKRVLHKKGV